MQIKRNYREPFFRGRRKSRGINPLIFVLIFLIGVGVYAALNPAQVRSTALQLMGAGPTPTPLPGTLASQGMALYASGDIAGAVALLERAVEQRPETVEYLYELGNMLLDKDPSEPQRAYDLSEQINQVSPNDVRGFALKARALVWQDQPAAAVPIGLAGLQVDPTFGALYATLARAYTNNQDWQQGLDYAELAIEISPNDVHAWWAYAHALRTVGAFDESISALERAIEISPSFLPPYFELAFLLLALDRDQEAIDTYDLILGRQPRNARALLRQCEAYRKIGEFQRAIGLCEDSVNADPTFVPAQFQLGLIRYNDRRFEEARTAFQACVDYDPGNLQCNFRLGLTHYYLATEAHTACTQDPSSDACTSDAYTGGCDVAWNMLNESLVMAQAAGGQEEVIDIIRQGLTAISQDRACPQYSGRITVPEPEVETTAEAETTAEPEQTGDASAP